MTAASIPLPAYSPALFVDRDIEAALAVEVARHIHDGASEGPRPILCRGERGTGSTWLAVRLQRPIFPGIPGVTPLLINFFPPPAELMPQANEWFADVPPAFGQADLDQLTKRIVQWVATCVGAMTAPEASLRELTNWLVRDVEQSFRRQVLALSLDSVFEADWDLLARLETHLLAPLAALPRVLIVMTGRGRLYPWESPYLRVDVADARLSPFDPETVVTQLKQQAPGAELRAGSIKDLGGGHP